MLCRKLISELATNLATDASQKATNGMVSRSTSCPSYTFRDAHVHVHDNTSILASILALAIKISNIPSVA